jgi:UDP-2,3-diacylglucosamine pyrophosphatase LpxH
LKKKAKLLTRNSEAVQFGAIRYAKKKKYDAVFCGHTHMAMLTRVGNIVYGNDGTWQSDDPHFIGIKESRVDLCKYVSKKVEVVARELL